MLYGLQPDYIPRLDSMRDKLLTDLAQLMGQPGMEERLHAFVRLEGECAGHIIYALKKLGWEFEPGRSFTTASMAKALGVVKRHQELLERMLMMLEEDGLVGRSDGCREFRSAPSVTGMFRQSGLTTGAEAEAVLLERCGSGLAQVLTGKEDPARLIFPDGDPGIVSKVYREAFVIREMNILLRKGMELALSRLPSGRGCRILEVGAGTGSTTSFLLPHLPPDRTVYTFTDVSPAFIKGAPEEFSGYGFVEYGTLNIEQDPAAQGFPSGHYDFVVASNVFHATRDLAETLTNVRHLLAPRGMLLFLEITAPVRWIDLVFGMMQGWWRFSDTGLRPSYPLVSGEKWLELMGRCGFTEAFSISPGDILTSGIPFPVGKVFPQSLLAAKKG